MIGCLIIFVTAQLSKVVEYQLYCTRSILRNARFSSKYRKSTSLLLLIIKHLGTFRYLSSYSSLWNYLGIVCPPLRYAYRKTWFWLLNCYTVFESGLSSVLVQIFKSLWPYRNNQLFLLLILLIISRSIPKQYNTNDTFCTNLRVVREAVLSRKKVKITLIVS